MHVLVTNDDGPPSADAPYFHQFVNALKRHTDWDVSVVVPNVQRSWIGKAHLMGHDVQASYIYPGEHIGDAFSAAYDQPDDTREEEPWILLDGTPASCANIGIAHVNKHKGPVELVISGPNYGRNCTALYIMSSGTVGAVMEAALCGTKGVGLSFSYKHKGVHNQQHINEAADHAVEIVKKLYREWDSRVKLYTVNIPLQDNVSKAKIHYAPILENQWGASYDEPAVVDGKTKFRWNPDFAACNKSVEESSESCPGNDGWVVANDMISITPLRASFKEVPGITGEFKLSESCVVELDQQHYLYRMWVDALQKHHLQLSSDTTGKVFHYADYDDLDFDRLAGDAEYLGCSYIYRKALIRKHYLSNTILHYVAKHPDSVLKRAYPESYHLEVDYAEFLDDALDEAYELRQQIDAGTDVWILKPSMSDRAQGIRLFSSIDQLQEIFDEFEESREEEDDSRGVITSQMRHFVVQKYVSNPLLLPLHFNRKFHIRTYVLCVGALKVYVYDDMLALFANTGYTPPSEEMKMDGHLTNTCIQGVDADEESVHRFSSLRGVSDQDKKRVFDEICRITGDVFHAAASVDRINFQPLPNAFEFYGLDFLVQDDLSVVLLEVNAYPDFKQTGDELKDVVYGLIDATTGQVVKPFFTGTPQTDKRLVKVLDYAMNR